MRPSLDTNVILRLVLNDVPDQVQQARALLGRARPGSLVIEDVVFFECVWVLTGPPYNFSREAVTELLLGIVRVPAFSCNRALVEKVMPLYIQHPTLSFIDVALAVYAELRGSGQLLSFDKKLAKKLPGAVNTDIAGA